MSLYRSMGRGSWVVKRKLPLLGEIRKATGCYDRSQAEEFERMLVKLARHGRRDLIQAWLRNEVTGVELLANVERFGILYEPTPVGPMAQPKARSWREGRRWLYFVRRQDTGLIKIGVTRNLRKRLRYLASAGGAAVELLVAYPDNGGEERKLHDQFSASRELGEWFRPSPALLAVVEDKKLLPGIQRGA